MQGEGRAPCSLPQHAADYRARALSHLMEGPPGHTRPHWRMPRLPSLGSGTAQPLSCLALKERGCWLLSYLGRA